MVSCLNVVFGVNKSEVLDNLLICLCKFHIHKQRLKKRRPSVNILRKEIEIYYQVEECIFTQRMQLEKLVNKWQGIMVPE